MEKTVTLRPYDHDVSDDVFSCLFNHIDQETETGLMEIPSASYQLIVSALEMVRWECTGADLETIKRATAIVSGLRDQQKRREWNRRKAG